jgi:large subunit ribosomal protein L15
MKLNELSPAAGSKKSRKRVGRGNGSGHGTTSGRGNKGHNSRSGGGVRPGFEGGQMPLHRRLPKRGFTNIFAKRIATVNVRDLNAFESGSVIDQAVLQEKGLVRKNIDGVKILGQGAVDRPLTVKVGGISQSAREKIESAGGTVEVL